MSYNKTMTNATDSVRVAAAGPHFVPVNGEVKDIKSQGVGTITYTDNSGNSTTADVVQGELLMMRGDITVTASTVDYIVYT
jgi:ABC-type uncharacterized transport system ATPase component